MKRLMQAFENEYNNFEFYIFADESKIEIGSVPLYHYRKPSSYTQTLPSETANFPEKINIWGAISKRGACYFEVFYFIFFY